MNEYIFFDAGLRDRVMEYAKGQGIMCELPDDNMGLVVAVTEDLPDVPVDTIDSAGLKAAEAKHRYQLDHPCAQLSLLSRRCRWE